MKLKLWIRIQTITVVKKLLILVGVLIIPLFSLILFINQQAHIDSLFAANRATTLSSLQTGDLVLLEKVLATYRLDKAVGKFEVVDNTNEIIKSYAKSEKHLINFNRVLPITSADGEAWGQISIFWSPQFDFLIYFFVAMSAIIFFAGFIVFSSWYGFSKLIVESVEQMHSSPGKENIPNFVNQIDDLNQVYKRLQTAKIQEDKANKLILQREKEKILIELSQKVAHDLRTPLSSLSLLLYTLKLENEHKDLINLSMLRMREICEELLNERKTHVLQPENVSNSIYNISNELKLIYPNKNLELQIADNAKDFSSSDSEFKSTLSNLICNAFDAVAPASGLIKIFLQKIENQMVVEINDNGQGIPSFILSQLGEKPVTHGKGSSGNGLGFYNAKKWANARGGDLTIDSTVGQGTTVHLRLAIP